MKLTPCISNSPLKIYRKLIPPLIPKYATMIDPVTRWFKITKYGEKVLTIMNIVKICG